ncbi:bifunctional 5,10-methylenetetrahydrofolate dehydrogenase/5,10-methenyltetrahydrofolate cyclohydrolase [Planosporangium mesophilum]|uniref:Bifunctional protein FolD n=1 Tax=Planosporangium mesophilum TaxID=689768 RepID=A0A8J3T961_9ACTN|nr:bifunctional 5,10-methylenetetrahydrofolate dehydrogenase/5,10-methenyltetrahydrofolate cyclohydrolase [Planosporangium mesophilum]NJC81424.1 bifunctional 5,10-methylenetetrahydrofolate dehydrogenase/5,10-methenyltetrahydrofolate cyclohydrolase [Planosporangium mesophilum]GII20922.1 bifunctional protein FolD [Planosporangium mesophilum]
MTLIDGRAISKAILEGVTAGVAELRAAGTTPALAIVVPTDDEATAWYVRSIVRAAERVGIEARRIDLHGTTAVELVTELAALSADPAVHGIICQTPLPKGITLDQVGQHIAPAKDVDGANPESLGRLAAGLPAFAPATAQAVVEILQREQTPLEGADVVVVGRSNVVGKPAALLLLAENATVTICHSRTRDLAAHTRQGDVLVAAVGRARMLGAEHVKPGAVVIDVGTNPTPDGGLVGDVDTEAVEPVAGAITPVPGGVGPVTTALLLRNVVTAARG